MKKNWLYTLCLISGVALFSTVEIAGKAINQQLAAYDFTISPMPMVFIRFIVTGLVLTAISLPRYLRKNRLTLNDILIFLLNGFLGIFCSLYLFHLGIGLFENASSAAVVFSANALFTCVLAKYINKEPLTSRKIIAVLVGLVGVSLFVFEKGRPSLGTLYAMLVMCASALLFASSVCITRRVVKKYGAMLFMGMTSVAGSLIALPFCYIINDGLQLEVVRYALPSMTYMVIMGTTVAYLMYYVGLSGVSAFKASMIFFLKPCLACIFAWIYLNNRMNAWTITSTIIIMFAMFLTLNVKSESHKKVELNK